MLSCLVPCRRPPDTSYLLTYVLEVGEGVGANSYFQQLSVGRDFLLIRKIPSTLLIRL